MNDDTPLIPHQPDPRHLGRNYMAELLHEVQQLRQEHQQQQAEAREMAGLLRDLVELQKALVAAMGHPQAQPPAGR